MSHDRFPTIHVLTVSPGEGGDRLDRWLTQHVPDLSRAQAQRLIRQGRALVDDVPRKASYRVQVGAEICLEIPPAQPFDLQPEPIPLDILYEDADLLVLNKPAGLVVHPAPGHTSGTLVHALLYHCPDLPGIGGEIRPGIVHRLDRDTSGLLVVAKTERAHWGLAEQIAERRAERRYLALLWGEARSQEWEVDAPIGRHPHDRKRMAVVEGGRPAQTRFQVIESFPAIPALLVEARLKTGRTHQIRVHAAHAGCPMIGDPVYGQRAARRYLPTPYPALNAAIERLPGQALHAAFLRLCHPARGNWMEFGAPAPQEFERVLQEMRRAQETRGDKRPATPNPLMPGAPGARVG